MLLAASCLRRNAEHQTQESMTIKTRCDATVPQSLPTSSDQHCRIATRLRFPIVGLTPFRPVPISSPLSNQHRSIVNFPTLIASWSEQPVRVRCIALFRLSVGCFKRWLTQAGNLLIKLLWKHVQIVLIYLGFLPILQHDKLGKHLLGERARHNEKGMAVAPAIFSRLPEVNMITAWPSGKMKTIHLGFSLLATLAQEPLPLEA